MMYSRFEKALLFLWFLMIRPCWCIHHHMNINATWLVLWGSLYEFLYFMNSCVAHAHHCLEEIWMSVPRPKHSLKSTLRVVLRLTPNSDLLKISFFNHITNQIFPGGGRTPPPNLQGFKEVLKIKRKFRGQNKQILIIMYNTLKHFVENPFLESFI